MSRVLSVLIVCMLVFGNTSVGDEVPSTRELALQMGGGVTGYISGSMLGLLTAPIIALTGSYEHCADLSEDEIDPFTEMPKRQSCYLSEGILRANQLNSYTAAGATLGTITGVLMSARAQGYQGSTVGASLGTFLGYVLMKHLNMSFLREINISADILAQSGASSANDREGLDYKVIVVPIAIPFVVSICALIGYHLL